MRLLLLLTLLFSLCQVKAQKTILSLVKNPVERGDELFNEFSYTSAIEAYKKGLASSDTPEDSIEVRIAESYRKLNQPEEASIWYERALNDNLENADPKHLLHYAEALSSQKKYAEAKKWYKLYDELVAADSRADRKLSTLENQNKLYTNESKVSVEKATFNSESADFAPTVTPEGIVFVSSRASKNPLNAVFNWDQSNYLDLFLYADDKIKRLDKTLNSKLHEGPAVFYEEGNKVIFTRNNHEKGKVKTSEEGITKLKLFYAERNAEGEWTKPVELPFNSDEYSVGHPAISADGGTLYFASDMPGGHGGVDIYKSIWNNGAWGEPTNLGSEINTEGNELFPTLFEDKELYFASNGHGGLGGLDIFVVDITKNTIVVNNIGSPINGPLDDFGLLMLSDGRSGYFSSNREGSGNNDDIYTFTATGALIQNYLVKGTVLDKKDKIPVSEVLVYLVDDKGTIINSVKTDADGNYSMVVEPNQSYLLQAGKTDYLKTEDQLVTTGDESKTTWEKDLIISKDYGFSLKGLITDNATNEALPGVKVALIDNLSNELVLELKTQNDGLINYKIKNYELDERISYQLKLEKEGYLAKVLVYNTVLNEPGEYSINADLNLGLDKLEIGADIGKLIDIQPIYFDVGKYTIRPDAAKELDKVVEIMKENPGIEIELGSHTDSRGSASSNFRLSDKRAKASAEYIISQGIDEARIVGKGYGEQQLINRCSDGVPCSKEEHQLNRRTEFKITKF